MEMMLIIIVSITHLVALVWAIGLAVIANMENCDE
jgi:hypothetical protein